MSRKRVDRSQLPVSFLPHGNPNARMAYLCAIIGLIPGLGLVFGPAAVVYGRLGYVAARTELDGAGFGHSLISMVFGGLETVFTTVGLAFIGSYYDWI